LGQHNGDMDASSLDMPIDPSAPAVTGGISADRAAGLASSLRTSPLTGHGTNTYVVGHEQPVVIDPGMHDAAHLARILDVTDRTIDAVICTHSHPDHSPGAAELRVRTGARVVGLPAPRDPYQDETYVPDATLADDELLRHPEFRLRALRTPGHVSNHLCLLLEDERLLFTGDHLMQGTTVVIIPPEGSMRDYLASLQGSASIDALAPGRHRHPRCAGRDRTCHRSPPGREAKAGAGRAWRATSMSCCRLTTFPWRSTAGYDTTARMRSSSSRMVGERD
jgi:glyoxylase-like metal-dependent hydrolase (beta-lactamase superfamily II)